MNYKIFLLKESNVLYNDKLGYNIKKGGPATNI